MSIRDEILPLVKGRDWRGCHVLLDHASVSADRDERASVAYWRSVVYEREGREGEALNLIRANREDFSCKCLPDYLSAKLLKRAKRPQEAAALLSATPILEEANQFPALAREAAHLYCVLLAEAGESVPPKFLALLPDDFQTMDDRGRLVGKSDLLALMIATPKSRSLPPRNHAKIKAERS